LGRGVGGGPELAGMLLESRGRELNCLGFWLIVVCVYVYVCVFFVCVSCVARRVLVRVLVRVFAECTRIAEHEAAEEVVGRAGIESDGLLCGVLQRQVQR
jgi:hypothetical protein